jgi:hypothetical protein
MVGREWHAIVPLAPDSNRATVTSAVIFDTGIEISPALVGQVWSTDFSRQSLGSTAKLRQKHDRLSGTSATARKTIHETHEVLIRVISWIVFPRSKYTKPGPRDAAFYKANRPNTFANPSHQLSASID